VRSINIGAAIVVAVLFIIPQNSFAASSHAAFCARWKNICLHGRSGCQTFRNQEFCKQICADREVSCRATGCFPFNKGGSQCDGK